MEKDLFRIMQNLKININIINSKDIDKMINLQSKNEANQQSLIELHKRTYILLHIKFYLKNIMTLGINYYKNKNFFAFEKEILKGAIHIAEDTYDEIVYELASYELDKQNMNRKRQILINNLNQIQAFLDFNTKLTDEERQKYYNYKIN